MSSEDLAGNLENYQGQLQQVHVALISDPQNQDLLKLKNDLQELVQLTTQLLEPSTSGVQDTSLRDGGIKRKVPDDDVSQWRSGDKCMAPWSEDDQYYEAVIEDVTEDGQCTVTFAHYGNSDVALLHQLRSVNEDRNTDPSGESSKSKRQKVQAEKDARKKKAQKKAQRRKEVEQQRENTKQKWQSFLSKSGKKKGCVKKSIFATPDTLSGRVGVGTCGIGGKPMTEYQQNPYLQKERRPTLLPPHLNG